MSSFVPPPYLPLIIILVSIDIVLIIFCLYRIFQNLELSRKKKIGWGFTVLFFCFFGPLAYILTSRKEDFSE